MKASISTIPLKEEYNVFKVFWICLEKLILKKKKYLNYCIYNLLPLTNCFISVYETLLFKNVSFEQYKNHIFFSMVLRPFFLRTSSLYSSDEYVDTVAYFWVFFFSLKTGSFTQIILVQLFWKNMNFLLCLMYLIQLKFSKLRVLHNRYNSLTLLENLVNHLWSREFDNYFKYINIHVPNIIYKGMECY